MASYRVEATAEAHREIRRLPGTVRQRIWQLLRDLEREPRPSHSRALDVEALQVRLPAGDELRRSRLESWRILYLVEEAEQLVTVVAIRKRPPYHYEDLNELLRGVL